MRYPSRRIAIAGAGIAGLTAALCLARIGFHAIVHERAAEPGHVGAGLQLTPNATRILAQLGVLDALLPHAVRPEAVDLARLSDGAELLSLAFSPQWRKAAGAPWLVAHRADLHRALLEVARATPDVEIRFGSTIDDFAIHPDGVTVGSRSNSHFDETACLALVGADGVWSTLRERIPDSRRAAFSGLVAWRTMAMAPLPGARAGRVTAWLAPNAHIVTYPVKGGNWTNVVGIARGGGAVREWSIPDVSDQFLGRLGRLDPDLAGLLRNTGDWTRWPLYEVDPAGPWVDRRLALIGDAAHAMTPFAAQGACMAIEDAWALALALQESRDTPERALASYAEARRPRVRRVVKRAAFNRFVYHLSGPAALARDMTFRARPAASFLGDLDWLYMHRMDALERHDPATLAWKGR